MIFQRKSSKYGVCFTVTEPQALDSAVRVLSGQRFHMAAVLQNRSGAQGPELAMLLIQGLN